MAIGGVETPQSTGRPYIPVEDAVRAGAGDATAEMQGIIDADEGLPPLMSEDTAGFDDPNFDTTTTGAPPIIPAPPNPTGDPATAPGVDIGPQPRRGSGRGFKIGYDGPQIDPDRQFTNRDYYGTNPRIAGSMGGREMYMPSFGEVPMGVLASQLQAKQAERAALAKKREAFRLDAGLKETAPQFQQEFTKYSGASLANFQDGVIAQFDGNRSKALDHLVNTPEGQRAWQRKVAELNAIATEVKYVAEQAADVVDKNAKGLETSDPETLRYAERVVAGYGSLGTQGEVDLNQLIKDSRILNRTMSRNAFFKEFVTPAISSHLQTLEQQGAARNVEGKWVMDTTTTKSYDTAIEQYAKEMTRMGMFDHVNDAIAYLRGLLPTSQTIKSTVQNPYESAERKAKAKAAASGDGGSGPIIVSSVVTAPAKQQGGVVKGGEQTLRLTPYQETGKKKHKVSKVNVSMGDGQADLYAPSLEWNEDKGEFEISGMSLSESDTQTLKDRIEKEGDDATNTADFVTTMKIGKRESAPVSSNGDAMEVYWNSRDPYEVVAMQLRQRGYEDATSEGIKGLWENKRARTNVIKSLQ